MTDTQTTMKDLRAVRRMAELNQSDLAAQLGVATPYLSMLETSRDVLPTPEFEARWRAAVAAAERGKQ